MNVSKHQGTSRRIEGAVQDAMSRSRASIWALAIAVALPACTPPKPAASGDGDPAATPDPAASGSAAATPSAPGSIDVPGPAMAGRSGGGGGTSGPIAGAAGEAPAAPGVAALLDGGLHWGMSKEEVVKAHTSVGGILWKDFDKRLATASVGPQMKALEQERDSSMRAFERTWVEFGITPTGYDASGLRPEYTYRNQEALLQLQRDGKTRYFFFINNRLWKIYDAVPFATGTMGKTFADAVNMMNGKLGVRGRILAPEPDKGRTQTHVDWRDNVSHMRLVDRAGEGLTGVALEELTTLGNLGSLRGVKEANPMAIDPTIAAVTGGNRVDPNAAPEKDPSKDPKDPKKAPPKTAPKKK